MRDLVSNPMRYFYISYAAEGDAFGGCNYTNTKYPNRQEFEREMKEDLGVNVIIINIIEMTEKDSQSFRAKQS